MALLRPRGPLILNEHAVDRLDEPTARWYPDKRAQVGPALMDAGAIQATGVRYIGEKPVTGTT